MATASDTSSEDDFVPLVKQIVESLLENFDCQPVLFVGAGLARRYINAPDWEGALRGLLDRLPQGRPDYEYLSQKHNADKVKIGSEISDLVFEWAWNAGKSQFPEEFYSSDSKSIFMKFILSQALAEITPNEIKGETKELSDEIAALGAIRPHAFITTNYDNMLETLFPGYEAIIGKSVLRYNLNAYGEVYHIHGSVNAPETMIITSEDYEVWSEESKYFAAKLLTYFAEHPVFIFGYGLGDKNVQTVLEDIGNIVADETGLISNVIQVVYDEKLDQGSSQSEFAIPVGGKQYRIRVLNTNSLLDVFKSLTARHDLKDVNPAMVRALAARAMKLTRSDIPNGNIEVDYKTLEGIIASEEKLPALLGITQTDDVNKSHPYLLSRVGKELGFNGWNGAHKLLEKIKEDTGVDIKSTDNKYHCAIKVGNKDSSVSRKYSPALISLLEKVRDGKKYEVTI